MAGGVYSTVRVKQINGSPEYTGYRAAIPSSRNICVEAQKGTVVPGQASPSRIDDLCSQAKTFEALEYVLFGLGAVAAGTGVLILLTESPDKKPASALGLRLLPELGPHRGVVRLGLDF